MNQIRFPLPAGRGPHRTGSLLRLAGLAAGLCGALLPAAARAADGLVWTDGSPFAEPADGGNLDPRYSSFDGATVTIVPRAQANEAVSGGTRWRNVLFALRGMKGRAPVFRLPLTSPGSGKEIHAGDLVSFQSVKLVWSYEPDAITHWNAFDHYTRTGTAAASWRIDAQNDAPFTEDVVYVSINEHYPVGDFYDWLATTVFPDPLVAPTPSEAIPGTFIIGYQSGAPAGAAFSRAIPDQPLFGFVIRDPAAHPTRLVVLVSGQHPYEGQNKAALQGARDWILHAPDAAAYRAACVTVVYPFVNPTGELAGLWRGTAANPYVDTNRNWNTTLTSPAQNRGLDTVILHKRALQTDIAALGLGEPYAVFDYHQNFGDQPGHPDYVLHSTASTASTAQEARRTASAVFTPYFNRLAGLASVAPIASDTTSQETLRGYMIMRGATLPLTFERSTYHTIASEWAFGAATVQALIPAPVPVDPPPAAPAAPEPDAPAAPAPAATALIAAPAAPASGDTPGAVLLDDAFSGSGGLNRTAPGRADASSAAWTVEAGALSFDGAAGVAATNSARATIDAGTADAVVTGTIDLGTDNTGLILRSSDASNYLRFVLSAGGWSLQQTAAGATTTLAHGAGAYTRLQAHTLEAALSGATIALTIDGVAVGTSSISFNIGATRFGLLSSGSGPRHWESFVVRGNASAPAAADTPSEPSLAPAPAGGGADVLLDDPFTGSGGLNRTAPGLTDAAGTAWKVEAGTFAFDGASGVEATNSGRATIDAGAADAVVTAALDLGTDNTGLVLRSADASNYLRFVLSAGGWSLQQTEAGTTTTYPKPASSG